MKWILIGIWLIYILLFFLSRKVKVKSNQKNISVFFYQIALWIVQIKAIQNLIPSKIKQKLKLLYPTYETKTLVLHFYAKKLSLVLICFFIGVHLIALLAYRDYKNSVFLTNDEVLRAEYGEEDTPVSFWVKQKDQKEKLSYSILARSYTKEEITKQAEEFIGSIEEYILGTNQSLDEVRENLLLKDSYDGFGFETDWEISDYSLMTEEGELDNEELKEPCVLICTCLISYQGEEIEIYEFPIKVCPKIISEKEEQTNLFLQALKEEDEKQKTNQTFHLPQTISKERVEYEPIKSGYTGWYFLGLIIFCILFFFAKDRDLDKLKDQRQTLLMLAYPEFVSQLSLLMGAGLSMRSAFEKLSKSKGIDGCLRQELKLFERDMQNGELETKALDDFGKRCKNSYYIKLCALLIQNMKKGNEELTLQLYLESKEAFQKRKNEARKLGELASTKLLLPMMGMLMVVMILIIVPAFMSF